MMTLALSLISHLAYHKAYGLSLLLISLWLTMSYLIHLVRLLAYHVIFDSFGFWLLAYHVIFDSLGKAFGLPCHI